MERVHRLNYKKKFKAFSPCKQITMKCCFHEAGHAAAHILSGELVFIDHLSVVHITKKTISDFERLGNIRVHVPHLPLYLIGALHPDRRISLKHAYLDSICRIAGFVSQNEFLKKIDPHEPCDDNYSLYLDGSFQNTLPFYSEPGTDLARVEKIAWLLYPKESHEGRRFMFVRKTFSLAEEMLEIPEIWPLVEDIACDLFNKKRLEGKDLLEICCGYFKQYATPFMNHRRWRRRFKGWLPRYNMNIDIRDFLGQG